MRNRKIYFVSAMLFGWSALTGQVQVSKEPLHKKGLENKYLRLLDVWIKPGDTTLYHIHSTPSLFLHFTNTVVCSQAKGEAWVKGKNKKGEADYVSFKNETWVHRVSNCDTIPFHVTDLELLSSWKPNTPLQLLPFTVLFDNDRAVAYKLTQSSFNNHISNRGPMVAQLVSGDEVMYNDAKKKKSTSIKTGKYLYIKPANSFYFSAKDNEEINMVLFEIK